MPAPVAMFAFNRPWHLNKSLKSLSLCKLSDSTDLIIFIDGPRKKSDERKISNNINIINLYKNSFNSIRVIQSSTNKGCATSILDGIEEIFNKYENIIVLEDDIEVSIYFLDFMNNSLKIFQDQKNVYHINGFNFNINYSKIKNAEISSVFLLVTLVLIDSN